jgi:THO complex subunit 2
METIPSLPHNLYNLFYSLELYDVYGMQNIQIINILVPIKSYQDAFLRIKQQQLDKNIAPKKKETADSLLKSLVEEKDAQIKHNEALVTLIKRARHVIIQSLDDQSGEADTMWQFLQNCILPRVLYSSTDAIYCAKFIEMMHLASVPYFSTLQCYFRSFSSIPAWLMSCTENEADRIGRFLRTLLATIKPWIEDEEKYKQYAYKIGFVKNIKNIDSGIMDYQVFKKSVVKKLCSTLTAGFEVVFAKADSTCARNVLKALNHAASNNLFPMYRRDAEKLKECVGKLADSEIENIKVLATRYATNLDQLISKVLPPEEKKPAPVQAVQQLSALSAPFVPPSRRDSKKDDKEPTTPVTPKPQREEKRADRSPSTEIGDRKRREDRGKDERRRGRDRKAERTEDQPVEEKSSKNDKMDVDEKESSTPTPSPATPVTPSGSRRKEVKREASEPPPPPPPASPTKESSPKRDEKATGEQMNLKLQELLSKKKEEERDTRKDGRGDSRDKHRDDAPPPPPPSNDKHDDERGSRHHDRDGRDGRDNRGRNRGDRDNRRNERRNDDPPAKDRGTKREREDSKQRVDEEKEPKRRKDTEDEPSVKEERKEERGGRRRITRPHV